MKTPSRPACAALLTIASPLAFAHAALVSSLPTNGQVLEAPPTEIHLMFNEHVEPRFSSIKLVSEKGKHWDCDRPHADRNAANGIVASVPYLRKGAYRARWTTVGADGHKTRGDLKFVIK
jgi:methionine-rich copper-binding protein CopC